MNVDISKVHIKFEILFIRNNRVYDFFFYFFILQYVKDIVGFMGFKVEYIGSVHVVVDDVFDVNVNVNFVCDKNCKFIFVECCDQFVVLLL